MGKRLLVLHGPNLKLLGEHNWGRTDEVVRSERERLQ